MNIVDANLTADQRLIRGWLRSHRYAETESRTRWLRGRAVYVPGGLTRDAQVQTHWLAGVRVRAGHVLAHGHQALVYTVRELPGLSGGWVLRVQFAAGHSEAERRREAVMIALGALSCSGREAYAGLVHTPQSFYVPAMIGGHRRLLFCQVQHRCDATLAERLARAGPNGFGFATAGRMLLAPMRTLAALHELPDGWVVNRDIHPANLLVDAAGLVRVADFGVGVIGESGRGTPVHTTVWGHPGWWPPEVAKRGVTPKADVWQIGQLLGLAATGQHPHLDAAAGHQVRAGQLPDSPRLAELDWRERTLIEEMVHPDPDRRPSLRQAVERCSSLVGEIADEHTVSAPARALATTSPVRHRRLTAPFPAFAAVAVAIAALLAVGLYGKSTPPPGGPGSKTPSRGPSTSAHPSPPASPDHEIAEALGATTTGTGPVGLSVSQFSVTDAPHGQLNVKMKVAVHNTSTVAIDISATRTSRLVLVYDPIGLPDWYSMWGPASRPVPVVIDDHRMLAVPPNPPERSELLSPTEATFETHWAGSTLGPGQRYADPTRYRGDLAFYLPAPSDGSVPPFLLGFLNASRTALVAAVETFGEEICGCDF